MKRKIDLLKAMNTFVMVAEKGSFSAVSRELNIVTSAISRQVSDLESHFSCQLLYRTTRAMHLTAEGTRYLEEFKEVLNRISSLENSTSDLDAALTGQLRISVPRGSVSLGFLKAASEFMKMHPDVKISWLFVNRFVNMVEEGIDLSIRIGELPASSYIARRYGTININFVASPEYIAQHGKPKQPKDLLEHQCITDSSNQFPKRWRYQVNGKESNIVVMSNIEANDGDIVAQLAVYGNGIAYLPTFLTQTYLDSGQLMPVLEDFEFDTVPVSLVYPASLMKNRALKSFVSYLLANR